MSLRQRDVAQPLEYPESDGEPMAETDLHAQLMIDLRFALRNFFADDPQVYVGSNLLMYYVGTGYLRSARGKQGAAT